MTKTLKEATGQSVEDVLKQQIKYALDQMSPEERSRFEKNIEVSSKPTLETARKILRQARQRQSLAESENGETKR